MRKMIAPCMVLLVLANLVAGQNPSPCPELFKYKPQGNEPDRWYGDISLKTPEDLTGVWLRVQLDQPASLLGNWFGEVTSTDNIEYDIINTKYKLAEGNTAKILFFVRYKEDSPIPSVANILLNGKSICVTQKTNEENTLSIGSGKTPTAEEENESDSESEFFLGDFAKRETSIQYQPSIQPSQKTIRSPECGIVASSRIPLISHGQDTAPGQWPWHAALYYPTKHQLKYFCGGTLITQKHILTAAHCVTRPHTNRTVSPSKILIYLGKYDMDTLDPEMQSRGVSKIFVHQDYDATVYFNDIAVLKLSEPVEITNFVRTCCLWEGESELEDVVKKEGTVVGWGFNENGDVPSKLKQAQMSIISKEKCIYSNRDFYSKVTFEENFCAGYRNGTSVCNADSGSGMMFPKKGTSGQNTVWQIRGLVSLGTALLPGEQICDTSQYLIFTDVTQYTHWIRNVLSQ